MSEPSESASKPESSASSLARSGTLSWQQRPSARGGSSRPLSMLASSSSLSTKNATAEEPEPSRDQIAASLGARDPTWFRQTADRGVGNPAYRKNQDETSSSDSFVSGRRGLPGMSREPVPESTSVNYPPPESVKSDTPSRPAAVQESTPSGTQFSSIRTSNSSKPDLKSLIAEDEEQAKASPMSERTSSSVTDGEQSTLGRAPTISSSQARIANAPERPSSPTKGMGGFVQSAMMKRSDSVTKRWSAQPGASLSRGDSVASVRNGYGGLAGSHSMPKMEPTTSNRDLSEKPTSKLSASNSNLTDLATTQGQDSNGFVKPSLPSHGRSQSVASNYNTTAEDTHTSPPSSPSKRWNPAKSTWLESAIAKPDSPKPSTARNSQPSWMAEIAKAKAQRTNVEGTSKPTEASGSRSTSPTKELFGQSILKRSESRDLGTPSTLTPTAPEQATARSGSPSNTMAGQDSFKPSDSQRIEPVSQSTTTLPQSTTVPLELKPADVPAKAKSQPIVEPEAKEEVKPTEPLNVSKPKPITPPKPQTDFRSNLRPRLQSETKQEEKPEFLSKFGNLRKTQTQNYVAPDVLKDNIMRGKSELAKSDGPIKTERRDELKESLLAKKELWKKEKDEGIVHERKVSQPPATPQKPEALAKRELLGRSETVKAPSSPEKPKTATPEALARHKSLKEKPQTDAPLPGLEKQTSAPASTPVEAAAGLPKKQTSMPTTSVAAASVKQTETSKLAARFNPGLAGIISRGPSAVPSSSDEHSRSESPAILERSSTPRMSAPSEPPADGGQLQDMRKGRAKGPKKRKGASKESEGDASAPAASDPVCEPVVEIHSASSERAIPPANEPGVSESIQKPKPRAVPGSAALVMMASLKKPSAPPEKPGELDNPATQLNNTAIESSKPLDEKPLTAVRSPIVSNAKSIESNTPSSVKSPAISSVKPTNDKPTAPAKSPALLSRGEPPVEKSSAITSVKQKTDVPEFKGFGSIKKPSLAAELEEDKENAGDGSPSVKSTVSQWGKQAAPQKAQPPAQITLPSKKDEEAAMRSAGLLASSPTRPDTSNGLGISIENSNGPVDTPPPSAGAPPRPAKSSRAVSGQVIEASPNKDDTARLLSSTFGTLPTSSGPLSIDTQAAITSSPHQERAFKTIRKSVQVTTPDGSRRELLQHEEYTFFDESVYICTHTYTIADGPKKAEMFLWSGDSSPKAAVEQAENTAKRLSKDIGNASVHAVSQGLEPPGFLQALGGILITRRGSQQGAPKQYMLRGRKHLGQIVFDEVDFKVDTLCSGFAYLISYYVSLQDARFYLWKGSACSAEEISAARLAAADLSESREVIEVDDGAEFASFLKIFGAGTTKASIPKPTDIWQQKSLAPNKFATRLFRIQPEEAKAGVFSSMFRRPSWGNLSPARKGEAHAKLVAKELSPFTQSDLEADCIYLLDAYGAMYVLVGPMLPTQSETVRNLLFGQTLLFASDYAMLAASIDDRPSVPKGYVLLSGVPQDVTLLFRHWDDTAGLWSGGGLMAASQAPSQNVLKILDLNEVLGLVC